MGQQQQQVMGQQRMMMGQSGGIIRGQQVMGQQQPQYVRMSGGQGMPQQRIMQGQNMTPGLRQILQQPGMMQQGGIMQQQRMGGPVPVQGGMIGQGVVGQGGQQQQNDPML